MLAENLSLRNEAYHLRIELEQGGNSSLQESIGTLKERLEAQIQELSGLAFDLGTIQKPASRTRRPSISNAERLFAQRKTQGEELLAGLEEGDDGRLPTIAEDKCYPRQSLECVASDAPSLAEHADGRSSEGVLRILRSSQETDSPDPGPPPVAHFDHIDAVELPAEQATEQPDHLQPAAEVDDLATGFPANLETRRKRRDIRRVSIFQSPPETRDQHHMPEEDLILPLRPSAKRKYGARTGDDESHDGVITATSKTFTNEPSTELNGAAIPSLASSWELANASGPDEMKTERRALGESTSNVNKILVSLDTDDTSESVNADPVASPKKAKATSNPKEDPAKPFPYSKPSNRTRKPKTVTEILNSEKQMKPVMTAIALDPPPTTPAPALGLFSPTSTEPSARAPSPTQPNSPPSHGSLASDSSAAPAARTARRARAPVNYAEPNLNRKMRRPTGALVDAVVREERRAASAAAGPIKLEEGRDGRETPISEAATGSGSADGERIKMRTVVIKREDGSAKGSSWKTSVPVASEQKGRQNGRLNEGHKNMGMDQERRREQASPLSDKSAAVAEAMSGNALLASKVADNPDSDTEVADTEGPDGPPQPSRPSASAAAIAALMNGASTARHRRVASASSCQGPSNGASAPDQRATRRASLAVYDFTASSSPADEEGSTALKAQVARVKKGERGGRSSLAAGGSGVRGLGGNDKGDEAGNLRIKDLKASRGKAAVETEPETGSDVRDNEPQRAARDRTIGRRRSMMV